MSRGGRGGFRGGRRPGAHPGLPFDHDNLNPDVKPSELFPEYGIPTASELTPQECDNVNHFLLFRQQVHDSPLYTHRPAPDPTSRTKLYSQEHGNQRYSVRSRATVDPFTAVPTYSHRFQSEERHLPDFSGRPFCEELFPKELRATLQGDDLPPGVKKKPTGKKKLQLSDVTSLPLAGEATGTNGDVEIEQNSSENRRNRVFEMMDKIGDEEGEEEEDNHEEGADEEQDHEYDDEDAGDYDAEIYFDGGEGEDYGGDDDMGGTDEI